MSFESSCLSRANVRFDRQTDDTCQRSAWLRRTAIAIAGRLDPRAWAERAIAGRYVGCAWNDTVEHEMTSQIMERGYGR